MKLVEESKPIADFGVDDYDGALFVGDQGPSSEAAAESILDTWEE